MKAEFLSRASHELRTPMNHIVGFAQLLEMDPLEPEQMESVRQILTSGSHLMTLIDRILAISASSSDDLSFLEASATQHGVRATFAGEGLGCTSARSHELSSSYVN